MHKIKIKKLKPLQIVLVAVAGVLVLAGGWLWRQNATAVHRLHVAKQQDTAGQLNGAKNILDHTSLFLVWPGTKKAIQDELRRNQTLSDNQKKLERAKQLLKENRTGEALDILNSIQGGGSSSAQSQVVQNLKKDAQKTSGSTSATKSGNSSGSSGGGNGGASGGSGGGTTPPPPPPPATSPMTAISIASFSATASPHNASSCLISKSVTFTPNGSGSVKVVWKMLSTKTSSSIDNPVTYNFGAAGSQSDSQNVFAQGLESGDSYRISVTVTSVSNGAVVATAGPSTVSSCAAPPALLPAQQPSAMTQIVPGALGISAVADNIFVNECSLTLQAPFSVNSSGTVQAVYTITSGSSGGATLYANTTHSFTGPGSATDTSYIRMPHLNGGDVYTIIAKLIDVGDQSITATSSPITTGCP